MTNSRRGSQCSGAVTGSSVGSNAVRTESSKSTLFVGNVSVKTKRRHIERIFSQYGQVESIRFRSVPIQQPSSQTVSSSSSSNAQRRLPRRVCIIQRHLQEGRTSINVYVCMADESDAITAAKATNGLEVDGNHWRVCLSTESQHLSTNASIFVGGLPEKLEEELLRRHFCTCGEIVSVRIIRSKKAVNNFGYVNFAQPSSVQMATKLDGSKLLNRPIRVRAYTENKRISRYSGSHKQASKSSATLSKSTKVNRKKPRWSQTERESRKLCRIKTVATATSAISSAGSGKRIVFHYNEDNDKIKPKDRQAVPSHSTKLEKFHCIRKSRKIKQKKKKSNIAKISIKKKRKQGAILTSTLPF